MFTIDAAHAQPFVCGETMVETGVGTTKEEVREKCGPPSVQSEDRWYYKNQPGQVTVVLTFVNDQLQQIENIPE
jgi:outer membrane protein assembly factor BamE (lipoprotein component of BamABCDE complex)